MEQERIRREEDLAKLFHTISLLENDVKSQPIADLLSIALDIMNGGRFPGQMEKVRDDQVMNNAGGFVFKVSEETLIRRFIIVGTAGGSYYQTEEKMTLNATKELIYIIHQLRGSVILSEIEAINRQNRAPKQTTMLFALALCARYRVKPDDKVPEGFRQYLRQLNDAALKLVPLVCRTPTHLFEFVDYCQMISGIVGSTGWGRSLRTTISEWYTKKSPEQLAMLMTKYPQREGWSHRDLFRLAHPKVKNVNDYVFGERRLEYEQLFRYAVKGDLLTRKRKALEAGDAGGAKHAKDGAGDSGYTDAQLDQELNSRPLNQIEAFLNLKHEESTEKIIAAIKEHGLVREHLPTDCLNTKEIWHTMLDQGMPMTALIRNLGKMESIGCLDEARTKIIVDQLTDQEQLRKSRIHPMNVLIAKAVYSRGRGVKGSLCWEPQPAINDALESAFYKSFVNAEPTGKRYLLALDVSGSMHSSCTGCHLSCRQAAAGLSLITVHNEKKVDVVGFSRRLTPLPFTKDTKLSEIDGILDELEFESTDCALPMLWAAENNKEYDVFVVYTDNETYSGDVHPFEALKRYREKTGIDAKLVVMGMSVTNFTIADPTDKGMMDIAGFDSAVPQILNEFVLGQI